jgi:hypothetical protein
MNDSNDPEPFASSKPHNVAPLSPPHSPSTLRNFRSAETPAGLGQIPLHLVGFFDTVLKTARHSFYGSCVWKSAFGVTLLNVLSETPAERGARSPEGELNCHPETDIYLRLNP